MRLLDPNTDSESDGESTNQLPNASFASGGISCNTPGPQPLHSAINTIRKLHDPLNLPIHSRDVSLQYGGSSLMMQEQQPLSSIIHPTENFPRPLDPPPHPRPQQQALKDPQVLRGSVVFSQPSNLVFCDLPGFALCDNRTLSQVETIKAQTSASHDLTFQRQHQMDLRPPSPYHDLWAVIIQCRRTDGTQNRETFRPIVISPLESQYHVDDPPCVIPAMIGIPIWMRRHNWQRYQSYDSRVHVWTPPPNVENRPAGWLDFNVNNDFDDVRISNIHIGDTLVARKDGKELTVPHLLMLCEFCRYIQTEVKWLAPAKDEDDDEEDDYNKPGIRNPARPLAAETPASKAGGKAEKRVVKLVSKKKFEEWCRRYRENKANTTGDERWRDYVLPTEI